MDESFRQMWASGEVQGLDIPTWCSPQTPLAAASLRSTTFCSGYLRRWLSVPRSFSAVGLYSSGTKLQLPLKSVTEEFKVTKVRQVIMLRDSIDDKVRGARVETRTGRKWDAKRTVKEAEERLRHGDIV